MVDLVIIFVVASVAMISNIRFNIIPCPLLKKRGGETPPHYVLD